MSDNAYHAIVLSETHWDRAWYLPFQQYRIRLVRLIDQLIKLLDEMPAFHSFMLDGQMVILEDYLQIRPEKRDDLERLIQNKRLFVGPWYILADEFLVSPEALIRNLMLGLRLAKSFGGEIMDEGYTPDSFGHISQLPQILNGFGINSAIFWRGFGDEADELGNEFYWDAPDGSRVLATHLRDGYHNIANIGYPTRGADRSAMELDAELALDQLEAAIELLKPGAQTPYLLLLDGVDHAEANPDIPQIIAMGNKALSGVTIEHGSLPDYMAQVRQAVAGINLLTFQGEFNRGKYAHVLQSVYATRIYLKQANDRAQRLLEQTVEPFAAIAWGLGGDYPAGLIWEAWKLLLKNHPHDDICGCSVDAVHREDMNRFAQVEQIGRALARDSARQIMAHVDCSQGDGIPFLLFNPTGWARTDTVEVEFIFDQNDDSTRQFHLLSAAGEPIPMQILEQRDHFAMEARKNHYQRRARVALQTEMPGIGYTTLFAKPGNSDAEPMVTLLSDGMENEFLKVTFNEDGAFNLFDKENGRIYRNLGYFLDEEDAGDEYDYAPCPNPQGISSRNMPAGISILHHGAAQISYKVEREFPLPISLTVDRQRRAEEQTICRIVTIVTMRGENKQVDLQVTVDNQVKDHRLRICFPTDIDTERASADGHFDVISRPIAIPDKPDWVQPPVPTRHQRAFVDLSDGKAGLAIFNRGLPEYEIFPSRNTAAITLLRCVDMLFRDDLLTRPGYAWLPANTPDAQCLGSHTFHLALAPHAGDWGAIYAQANQWLCPPIVRRGDETEGFVPWEGIPKEKKEYQLFKDTRFIPPDYSGELPATGSFFTIEPAQIVLSALKRSEDGKLLVLRLFNVSDGESVAAIFCRFPIKRAYRLTMNEAVIEGIGHQENDLRLLVKSKQAVTLGFEIERAAPKHIPSKG